MSKDDNSGKCPGREPGKKLIKRRHSRVALPSFLLFPPPFLPLLKSSKKSLRGGNKWWPTFSFFLSALTDWRLSTVRRPRRFNLRSLFCLSAAQNLVSTVIQPFISFLFLSFLPYFGGHTIFSSNDVASPETGFDSTLWLCGVSLAREAALLEASD